MNKFFGAGAVLLLSTTIASAGGLDRSGQPIGIIFEEGNVLQFSMGYVSPEVTGTTVGLGLGTNSSGNMAESYLQLGMGYRQQINDQLAFALIYDQPFGADVSYANADPAYYTGPASAEVNAWSITGVAQYRFNENVSVHGGVRYQTVNASVSKPTVPGGYSITSEDSSAVGYVVGAAYEIPDIALRVALTYNSAITHDITASEACGVTPPCNALATSQVTTPQSVNIDFQTGIAQDTLLFGSIRWAEWTAFDFAPPGHAVVPGGSLQDYDNDVWSYSIGIGRRFSDEWSGAVTVGYEAATGGFAGDLAPTDGSLSLGVGGTYTMDSGTELTAGIRYIMLGDTQTEHPLIAGTPGSTFADNSAIAIGLQITQSF